MCRSALSRGLAVSCHISAAVQEHSTQAEQESVLLTVPAGQSIMQFVAAWEHLVSYTFLLVSLMPSVQKLPWSWE